MTTSPLSIERIDARWKDERLEVAVLVCNRGDRPLFVVSRARRLHLDEGGVLELDYSDRGVKPDPLVRREWTRPPTVSLEPGEQYALVRTLPAELSCLRPLANAATGAPPFVLEKCDLRKVRHVRAVVAWALTPFYWNPKGPPIHVQIGEWARETELEVPASLGRDRAGTEQRQATD